MASPNAKILVELGFCELSRPGDGPLSFVDHDGKSIYELKGDEKVVATLVRFTLDAYVTTDAKQRLYVFLTSNAVMATGVYEDNHFWLKAEFEDMSEHGYRMVQGIGLVDKH